MKSITTPLLPAMPMPGLISGTRSAPCPDLYTAAYPSGNATLSCIDFPGDKKLHGILYGCKTLDQDVLAPPEVESLSFTEICEASVAPDKRFTCYQMAATTNFTPFTSSVDPNVVCGAEGDEFDSPKYMSLQSTAEYKQGGGAVSQSTNVASVVDQFSEDFGAKAYYIVTIEEVEGMTSNLTLLPPQIDPDTVPDDDQGLSAEVTVGVVIGALSVMILPICFYLTMQHHDSHEPSGT